MRNRLGKGLVAAVAVGALLALAGSAGAAHRDTGGLALGKDAAKSSLHPGGGSLVFDIFAPFSGPDARFGAHAIPGATVGADMLNSLGGVLGHKFKITHTDSRGDPADAVPALQQALATIHNLTVVLGPTSDEALATVPILRRQGIPTFAQVGSIQLDALRSKWVYRILSSDSQDASAMAYQAVFVDHAKRIALAFSADAGSQSLVPPLQRVLKQMGAKVVIDETLTPDQPSYRTEALQLEQAKPDVILTETDDATAATLWSQMFQLTGLKTRIIGSGPTTGQDYFQAVQQALGSSISQFQKVYSGIQFSTVNTCATPMFLKWFHKVYPGQQPLLGHVNYYDTLVLVGLAMLKAHSTNPNVWMPVVHTITNAPKGATRVCTFQQGRTLLAKHKAITYVGTKGPMTVNKSNTVTVNEEAITFDNQGNPVVRNQLTESELAKYNTGA